MRESWCHDMKLDKVGEMFLSRTIRLVWSQGKYITVELALSLGSFIAVHRNLLPWLPSFQTHLDADECQYLSPALKHNHHIMNPFHNLHLFNAWPFLTQHHVTSTWIIIISLIYIGFCAKKIHLYLIENVKLRYKA